MYCMSSGLCIPSKKNECHTNNNIALIEKNHSRILYKH